MKIGGGIVNTKILVIPDTHFPFEHKNFFKDLSKILINFKPTHIVHMGDMWDMHTISRHDPDPDAPDIKSELQLAKERVVKLTSMLKDYKRVYVCVGNHDNRIEKRAACHGIPKAFLVTWREMLELPKHWLVGDEHQIGDIAFLHGKSNLRGKTAMAYGCNVVMGHFHSMLEVTYLQTPRQLLWSVFAGGAVDDKSMGMAYGANNLAKSAYGFVLIENGIPRIVPGTRA